MRSPADGFITFVLVILAFLALDDITTDNATTFTFEYSCLAVCALWAFVLIIRLAVSRRFALAAISLCVLAAALWGQRSIGPGTLPSLQPYYLATVSAILWFLGLSFFLIATGWRQLATALPQKQ